jgi:phosphatidylserine decarboxylase
MLTPKVPVAREGYPFIGLAAFCAIFFGLLGYTAPALAGFAATVFTLAFFRDPERFVPRDEGVVVSPADGKIIMAEKVFDRQFTGKEVYKVSIFMNVFNVHVNRAPCAGKVRKIDYRPGKFYSADSQKGGLENEYCASFLDTPTGENIVCVQIAGLIARRIICWLEPGDRVSGGNRIGLIRFGSRVDLYLPATTTIKVRVGEKVCAGETIIGRLQETVS